jgi:hypothetical protein
MALVKTTRSASMLHQWSVHAVFLCLSSSPGESDTFVVLDHVHRAASSVI